MIRDREILVVDDSLVVVCSSPMMRPPAGWDARVRESTTRWAWNDDNVYPLEKSVLPNVYPGKQECGADKMNGHGSTNAVVSTTDGAKPSFSSFVHHCN